MIVNAVLEATQVMLTLHQHVATHDSSRRGALHTGTTWFNYARYEPHIKYQGTIVVVHGMSPKGIDDARIVALCQALCQVGYRVIAPEVEAIKALQIDTSQIQQVRDIFAALAADAECCPHGTLSVLAPSFSGAICLAAAADPSVAEAISAVCAIGTFTHVDSVVEYLLSDHAADPYGMYIALKKILPLVADNLEVLQPALDAAIQDNLDSAHAAHNKALLQAAKDSALTHYLHTLNNRDRAAVTRLLEDADYRSELFDLSRTAIQHELEQLNIAARLNTLRARVFLLHGKDDPVIPSAQSILLHRHLRQMKKQAALVITPFITHGDTRFRLAKLPDITRIVRGFAFFFDATKASSPSPATSS